jgi:hypothetical protein
MVTVLAIQSISLSQCIGAGQNLLLEVLGADATARFRHVQDHAAPQ